MMACRLWLLGEDVIMAAVSFFFNILVFAERGRQQSEHGESIGQRFFCERGFLRQFCACTCEVYFHQGEQPYIADIP